MSIWDTIQGRTFWRDTHLYFPLFLFSKNSSFSAWLWYETLWQKGEYNLSFFLKFQFKLKNQYLLPLWGFPAIMKQKIHMEQNMVKNPNWWLLACTYSNPLFIFFFLPKQITIMVLVSLLSSFVCTTSSQIILDHNKFLWNCPPTPPLTQYFPLIKRQVLILDRGGVGRRFPRNVTSKNRHYHIRPRPNYVTLTAM